MGIQPFLDKKVFLTIFYVLIRCKVDRKQISPKKNDHFYLGNTVARGYFLRTFEVHILWQATFV
jgi:hypothetical protein